MISPNPARRVAPASLRPLAGIREAIFVHAPHARVAQVAELCADDMLGAIYNVPKRGNRLAALGRVRSRHQEIAGPNATVLADANLYSGKNRKLGSDDLDLVWVQNQLDAGLPWAITDSGYVGRGEDDDLSKLFESGYAIAEATGGRALLALPLEYQWVQRRADAVRDFVDKYGIPIALILGASADPFETADTVRGLRHVVESPVPSVLLRTDMSALGAVAAGAALGAIGTSTSLRHIYPPAGGGPAGEVHTSALLPQGLSYQRLDIMAAAAALTPLEPYWDCNCNGCEGGRVDRHVITEEQAFAHSVRGALEIARETLRGATLEDNLKSFRARALSAQFIHFDIEANIASWKHPKFLGAWVGGTSDLA